MLNNLRFKLAELYALKLTSNLKQKKSSLFYLTICVIIYLSNIYESLSWRVWIDLIAYLFNPRKKSNKYSCVARKKTKKSPPLTRAGGEKKTHRVQAAAFSVYLHSQTVISCNAHQKIYFGHIYVDVHESALISRSHVRFILCTR